MSNVMERLVGENVKLRRRLEQRIEGQKHQRRTKDLLRLEEAKVERLTLRLNKMKDQMKDLKQQVKEIGADLHRHQKLFSQVLTTNKRLESEVQSIDARNQDRKARVRRIRESLRQLL